MRIALDYDGTYTRDPKAWDKVISIFQEMGHQIECVTMRYPSEPIDMPIQIIYTSRQAKMKATQDNPYDIWIDDNPAWIMTNA